MSLSAKARYAGVPAREGYVEVNDVRLHYLEWEGSGPCLLLIHGLGDNPYLFTDLASGFAGHFRVIAYARRGHGRSEVRPPYDTTTLTSDLLGLMRALKIDKAVLAGYSMGGNEITALAARNPDLVSALIYLDAGYDYSDPDYVAACEAVPAILRHTPPTAMRSLDAYREYYEAEYFSGLKDMRRVESYIRDSIAIRTDGTVKSFMEDVVPAVEKVLLADTPRAYERIRCPVLAIYAETTVSALGRDQARQQAARVWENQYMTPFREKSVERMRREIDDLEVITLPGGHNDFLLTARQQLISVMLQFLDANLPPAQVIE